jgi:hypothetical protein
MRSRWVSRSRRPRDAEAVAGGGELRRCVASDRRAEPVGGRGKRPLWAQARSPGFQPYHYTQIVVDKGDEIWFPNPQRRNIQARR